MLPEPRKISFSKENQTRRRDAIDYAAALHRIIKEELLRVVSKGNYTEINGTKYAVLYVSSKETLIRRYVQNSYVDYDHMNTFQVEITSHKTYRKSFFRYTPVIWQDLYDHTGQIQRLGLSAGTADQSVPDGFHRCETHYIRHQKSDGIPCFLSLGTQ